ncbi:MAG: hypothetical protein LBT74_10515 [Acidobacteriota bacterium]|jgi:dienelactone hydrolase|nr:hypothetical protein [Acidobacteriota bacterium]
MRVFCLVLACVAMVAVPFLLSGRPAQSGIPEVAFTGEDALLTVTSWRVIGPFKLPDDRQVYTIANEKEAFDRDWLAQVGGAEAPSRIGRATTKVEIDFDSDTALVPDGGGGPKPPAFLDQVVDFPIPQVSSHMLFGLGSDFFKVMYAAADIVSGEDAEAHVIVSGNSPTKVWLNDAVVAASPEGSVGNAQQLQHLAKVRLKAGKNRLVVKLFCFPLLNEFSVRLATAEGAEAHIRERGGVRDLLDRLAVAPDEPLRLTDNLGYLAAPGADVRYEIVAADGMLAAHGVVPATGKAEVPTRGLAQGLYRLWLYIGEESYSHPFYIGRPEGVYPSYRQRCVEAAGDAGAQYEPCLALAGLAEIHKDVEGKGFRQDWMKKALVYAEMVENGLYDNPNGFRMRSYRSPIDGQRQFYLFYRPETAPQAGPMPVIVEVPHNAYGTIVSQDPDALRTGESKDDPYYKAKTQSLVNRDANYLLRLARFCDEYGYACLFPFARFRQFEDPLAVADMREALAAAKRDYAIDAERVYLRGFCRGGGNSLRLAEDFPDEFAAVSAINLNVNQEPFPVSNHDWEAANDIRNAVGNLLHTPVQLVHGSHFPHSPVRQSREFHSLCRKNGVRAELELLAGDTQWDDRDEYRISFEFFEGKRREAMPSEISYATGQLKYPGAWWVRINRLSRPGEVGRVHAVAESRGHIRIEAENVAEVAILRDRLPKANTGASPRVTANGATAKCVGGDGRLVCELGDAGAPSALVKNGMVEGPLAHAFAAPFVLALGSGGDAAFREQAAAVADDIQTYWEGKHFVSLRRKADHELTEEEMRGMNIILVGEAGEGTPLRGACDDLPLTVSEDSIKIGDYVFPGEGAAAAAYPNPHNPERYLAVVAATGAGELSLPAADLARYGADVTVWRKNPEGKAALVGEWFWDNAWLHLTAASRALP